MSLIETLRAQRAAIKAELEALVSTAEGESRSLSDTENATFDTQVAEMGKLDERIAELQEAEVREAAAAAHRVATATVTVVSEPNPVYRRDNAETSYFKDILMAGKGDSQARERLIRSQETRAGDMTTVAGAGGEFAPPAWLVGDYVALARPHRVTADLLNGQTLPSGISSVNLPAVSTGAATGVQVTQNSALTDTALTTTSVSSGITLIAGKQIISRQLIDQSGIPFDRVILGDLAADYAKQLDTQVLSGTGANGQLNSLTNVAGNTVTFTNTQPVVVSATNAASFYFQLVSGLNKVYTGRFLPPSAIVMHPRRWAWVLNGLDSQNRPVIAPSGASFNAVGTAGNPAAEGSVGNILGVPVYVDPNVSTAANSSTNQDIAYILRADDSWLYETALESASFDATYADNASILFRVMGYSALVHRYAKSVTKIIGTGMVDPGL